MSLTRLSLNAMATTFEVALHGDDPARLRAAAEEALAEIERLDRLLSFYDPASVISHINSRAAIERVRVDAWVFRLLRRCVDLSRLTNGAFDITVAPLMRAWGFTGDTGALPAQEAVEAALRIVGTDRLALDEAGCTVRFDRPGVAVDLGAIGKGYAIERAVEVLRECGVTGGLIHGGTSTVYGIGTPPDEDAWQVAIRNPADESTPVEVVGLRDSALSVSALHGKSFAEGGTEYGHIIDPRTGQAKSDTPLAAVTGPSPGDSDALSTALLVLGSEFLSVLPARFPGYRGIVTGDVEH